MQALEVLRRGFRAPGPRPQDPAVRAPGPRPQDPAVLAPGPRPPALVVLAAFAFFLASAPLGRAAETPGPLPAVPPPARTEKAPFYLLADYLPVALYDGEPLTACFRVENLTPNAAEVVVRAEAVDAAGQVLRSDDGPLHSAAAGFAAYQKDHDLNGVRNLRFSLRTPLGVFPGPEVRVLREEEPWPETHVAGGRQSIAGGGTVLLPVVRRRLKTEDRSWAPVRWALGARDQDDAAPVNTAMLLVPGAWEAAAGVSAGQAANTATLVPEAARGGTPCTRLGPYPLEGVAPILSAVGDVLRALPDPAPDRVVVLLPPEDLEAGTEARLYGLAVEVLLARLAGAGVRQTVLLPPFQYGIPERRQKPLWGAVQEATQAHKARGVSVNELIEEPLWRLDPATPGAYGRAPNEAGRKKIAQTLAHLLP